MNNKILLEQSPTAIAMFDMELKYIAASLKWMEEYSLQGKNIIGLSHYEVFPEIGDDWKAIHQECLRGAVNKCEEAYFKRADGTEQWISWDVRPWYDDDDKIGGLLMYTVDITIRKVTEKKMEEERMLLRTLVNHIPLNVYVKDLKSRKMLVNKKELEYLGIKDEKDLLGKDDFDVYPYESAVSSTNEDRHVFQSGDPIINRETFSLKNDGNYSWFLTSKIPLRSTNGEIYGLVGLSHDITERKASEEKLRKYSILESKSEEMEQFAYVASHDLREPLLTIKNYIELLIEDYGHNLPEEGRRYTQSISRAANRMEELIKGLLDYSRLSRIKQLQEVDCNEIIKHVEEDLDSLISSTDTKITFGKLPTLKAYPLELNMLFQNLIDNAIKFRRNDTSPEIHISARSVRDGWKFEVRDNGLGIEKVDREKYLSCSKDFIPRMNIQEQGSVWHIAKNRRAAQRKYLGGVYSRQLEQILFHHFNRIVVKKKLNCILLIDDDNDCNYYHQKLLTKMNCADSVAIVNDGQQALDFLTTAVSGTYPVPAMIFLDINMPKMNGWEFLKEYEKLDATMKAKIVLVMLTTSLNPDDQEKAGKFPDVQGFKNKFLSKETLIETFKRHFPENF